MHGLGVAWKQVRRWFYVQTFDWSRYECRMEVNKLETERVVDLRDSSLVVVDGNGCLASPRLSARELVMNFYQVLGISRDCSNTELKKGKSQRVIQATLPILEDRFQSPIIFSRASGPSLAVTDCDNALYTQYQSWILTPIQFLCEIGRTKNRFGSLSSLPFQNPRLSSPNSLASIHSSSSAGPEMASGTF